MNKTLIISFLLTVVLISCKNAEKEIDNIKIAKEYYRIFEHKDYSGITTWFSDSLVTIEGNYKQTYSQKEYVEFLKWDAVFEPTYKILEIKKQGELVKATISKTGKRISFLHQEPIITNQLIRFEKDKIISIEIDYKNFNYEIFGQNRSQLLSWIDKNHPELNGFINDQTELGGINYLKALDLYKTKHHESTLY